MGPARLWIDGERLVQWFTRRTESQVRDSQARNVHAEEERTILELNTFLAGLQQRFAAPPPVIAFSDPAHFRKHLFPDYQAFSHLDTRGSVLARGLTQYLRRNLNCEWFAGMESVDVLGVLSTAPRPESFRGIAVTTHPLMHTVPGEWMDWQSGRVHEVSARAADRNFYRQVLLGYAADNIEGLYGLTPEAAEACLPAETERAVDCEENPAAWHRGMWKAVVAAYLQRGGNAGQALRCARGVRVLRFEDYDFKNRKVKLWTPPDLS